MACSFSLHIISVRSLPSEAVRAVLEVIVRTPRFLSTSKQKYASEPFSVQSARGVSLNWTQTKSAKAYVRLLLLPEEASPEADAAAAEAEVGAAAGSLSTAAMTATGGAVAGVPPSPMVAAAATSAFARGPAVAVSGGPSYQRVLKSSEALLQLLSGEQQQQQGMRGMHPPPGAAAAAQVQQLTLVFEPTEAGPTGVGDQSSGADGAPAAAATAVDLDLVVLAVGKGGADGLGAITAIAPATAAAAAGASCSSTPWAWSEVMSPPAAPPPHTPPRAPRKRSWLSALGLGRQVQTASGGAAAATIAAPSAAVNGGAAAGEQGNRAGVWCDPAAPAAGGGGGDDMVVGVAALGESSSLATCAWDPVAVLSSATTTATVTTTTVATVATVSSSSQAGHGNAPAAMSHRFQEAAGESAQWAAPPPPPAASHERQPRTATLEAARSLPGCATAAAAALSPFSTLALASAAAPTVQVVDLPMLDTAVAAGAALPAPPQLPHSAAAMATASTGCPAPQAPKRRRLGDFFARLFQPSSSDNQVRRITATEDSASSVGAAGGVMNGTATLAAMLPPPAPLASPLLRRLSTPVGLTLLPPPSPRLGDVYRVQDNALASDTAVQIGFPSVGDAAAAATATPAQAADQFPPGLESPGYGELSPAGGPDRLTIPPPVESMAAASLASPRATSPAAQMSGCFFWRYGAAARARVAAAAAADADADVAMPPPPPPGAGCLGRAGSAPALPAAAAAAAAGNAAAGRQLNTLSAGDALPADTPSYTSGTGCRTGDQILNQVQPTPNRPEGGHCSQKTIRHQTQGSAAAAAAAPWSDPLGGEISRVIEFVNAQKGLEEETRALALSQCQFLLDCLRSSEMCWLVGDSLLQLKREVGFPFDTGVPIAGAPGWFRLVLQHATTSAAAVAAAVPSAGSGTAAAAATTPPAAAAEVLKVRWACIDQGVVGGTNACAAICLEVAAWCLGAVQRWREASSSSGSPGLAGGGGGGSGRRDLAPALSRSQWDRLAASVELEAMCGASLEQCIRSGTEVWQAVLVQSPASRVATSTGDFDLEHMLQLGGYSLRLRLADYSAASLLEDGGVSGDGGGGCSAAVAPELQPPPAALADVAGLSGSENSPPPPPPPLAVPPDGDLTGDEAGWGPAAPPPPSTRSLRTGPQGGLPTFAALVRSLAQGVYVLGWRGHFATLWLRPGRVVHLIDSLGARLAADCPLAFVLEFDTPAEFLEFFLARHQARRDDAADDDISGANLAALIEVHRLELLQPAAATATATL